MRTNRGVLVCVVCERPTRQRGANGLCPVCDNARRAAKRQATREAKQAKAPTLAEAITALNAGRARVQRR